MMQKEQVDWREVALCRNYDISIFYSEYTAEAKRICRRCPSRWVCLDHAVATRESHGVWGGVSRYGRKALIERLEAEGTDFLEPHIDWTARYLAADS